MSKKGIWILTGIMTLALLGLLLVQAQWIINAVNLKEQQFSHIVNRALTEVINRMEEKEASIKITKEIKPYIDSIPMKLVVHNQKSNRGNIIRIGSSSSYSYISRYNGVSEFHELHISDTTFMFGAPIPVIILPDENFSEEIIREKNRLQLREERRKILRKYVIVEKVMDRMLSNPAKIEERIDPLKLYLEIQNELHQKGVDLDFEFSIRNPDNISFFKTPSFEHFTKSNVFLWQLFPGDLSPEKSILILYFPKDRNYLLRSLGWMGVSSTLLTLTIILIFSATLYIIFRQKQLSEIKSDFVNNMTHELKTPIATISLASQMLKDDTLVRGERNMDHISKILNDESKRLSYQVEKVLQMAVFDRGKLKLDLKEANIHQLISNVVDNFMLQVNNKNGEIKLDLKAVNPLIGTDEIHFTNILSNLIDNAIKYCNLKPNILISTQDSKKGLFVTIEDNGIGISKDNLKRIFHRFYRVPTGNIHNVKGFGLGLNYVKMIVEEHGGSIRVDSKINKGSRFKILFPRNL